MAASTDATRGIARPTAQGRVSEAVPRTLTAGDGLRALAALAVLALHAGIEVLLYKHSSGYRVEDQGSLRFEPLVGGAAPLLMLTRAGIYVFFALSGYLLSRGFLAAYTLGTPRPPVARYMRNRALRIIPAFWVVMILVLTWDHAWGAGGPGGLLATLLFAQNQHLTGAAVIPQAWTLDIEVAFYILIPLVSLLALSLSGRGPRTPAARLGLVLGLLLAAFAASLALKLDVGTPAGNTYNIAQYLFAFLPGVALGAVEPFAAPRLRASPSGGRWAWGALAAAAALLALFVILPASREGSSLIAVTLGCGALLGATLAMQWSGGGCWRVLDNRAMHWLGERSYGIYLIHLTVLAHVLPHIGQGHGNAATFGLLLAVGTAITLPAANILWRVVERPALQRRLPWRQVEFAPARTTASGQQLRA